MPGPRENLYTGPSIPVVYDPTWQSFTNLSPQQIVAFQSFPEDLLKYASTRRWLAEISGITIGGVPLTTQDRDQAKISQLKQAFDTGAIEGTVSFNDGAGNTQTVDSATATAIYDGVVQFIQGTYDTFATLKESIKAKSITTRAQIDDAYAKIAPSSPSANQPSAT